MQFGKYQYIPVPQGYADMGDRFNMTTEPLIRGVAHVIKSVDNLLGQCTYFQNYYDTLAPILERIIELGMIVAEKKLGWLCL